MMFDTLVRGPSDNQNEDQEGFQLFDSSKPYFDCYAPPPEDMLFGDPILLNLQRYYTGRDQGESSDVDLSWDEGDLSPQNIKVWTFNDFMGQYNQLYAFLNNIQVQYHAAKKGSASSPRVEGLLRDLERDVERRERFLRECARMVGAFPELEEEVGWRVEHVIAKWEMLGQLRGKGRSSGTGGSDIYSDIEMEVRCLRRWLREMEARIDPLQFGTIQLWSAGDRERKMEEYQVLQTDIESHGRIVKLVLGLCEELSQDPGLYDLQHSVRVARGLERRWHHIWLRSLEWQCLLEQWIHNPGLKEKEGDYSVFDTDDEPLSKVARLTSDLGSCLASPAATLLRRKRRKRWPGTPREEGREDTDERNTCSPGALHGETRERITRSPRLRRREEEREEPVKMQTSESDPSTSAPSTARSESSETSLNFHSETINCRDKGQDHQVRNTVSSLAPLSVMEVLGDIIDVDGNSHDGFWDTSDEDAFLDNKDKLMQKVRKVTVVHTSHFVTQPESEKKEEEVRRKRSEEQYSTDSLEAGGRCVRRVYRDDDARRILEDRRLQGENSSLKAEDNSLEGEHRSLELGEGSDSKTYWGEDSRKIWKHKCLEEEDSSLEGEESSLEGEHSSSSLSSSGNTDQEGLIRTSAPGAGEGRLTQLLSFGDDYRKYIDSLSDSSSSLKKGRGSRRIKKRNTRRRQAVHPSPYESQSEAELEEVCVALIASQATMEQVEAAVKDFFNRVMDTRDTETYEDILSQCSSNVNLLFHLLETVNKGDSFPNQKKCRDIRLLISRWEGLLQTVLETVHQTTVYRDLREQVEVLREGLTEGRRREEEELELHLKLKDIKTEQSQLTVQKASLLSLSLAVEVFLEDMSSSPHKEQELQVLAEVLRQEVVEVHGLWDVCHHQTSSALSQVEAGLHQLCQVQEELGSLQAELSLQSGALKLLCRAQGELSSEDSGWASEDCNLGGKQERLSRLRQMAERLQEVISPRSPSVVAVRAGIEATTAQLGGLQREVLRIRGKSRGRRKTRGVSRRSREGLLARKKKLAKYSVGVHLVLLLGLFLSWLCQPSCCDNFSAISAFSPQLKYVNGPPPI